MPRKPPKDPAVYFADMFAAANWVVNAAKGKSFADFQRDETLRFAVERQIQIVGEAARHVPRSVQQSMPSIPWPAIIGQRHVLVHEYGDVVAERLWRVVTIHLPDLIEQLRPVVPNEAGGDAENAIIPGADNTPPP